MTEVTLFYAYDDTEFTTREACEAYEKEVYDNLVSVCNKYSFFDADMNVFFPPVNTDIEELMRWLNESINGCIYFYRAENLTDDEDKLIRCECGYCVSNHDFNDTVGWFTWDGMACDWVEVDE